MYVICSRYLYRAMLYRQLILLRSDDRIGETVKDNHICLKRRNFPPLSLYFSLGRCWRKTTRNYTREDILNWMYVYTYTLYRTCTLGSRCRFLYIYIYIYIVNHFYIYL